MKDTCQHVIVKQEAETDEFKMIVKNITYIQAKKLKLQVGHRNEERHTRLFQIGGKKNFFVREVEVSAASLNQRFVDICLF